MALSVWEDGETGIWREGIPDPGLKIKRNGLQVWMEEERDGCEKVVQGYARREMG
jgi:hypothetical protein